MSPTEKKAKRPARRKRLVDQARRRRQQHEKVAQKRIREDRALTESAYRKERRFSDNLKTITKFLGSTVTLFVAGMHLYVFAMTGPVNLIVFVQAILVVAVTAFGFALVYLFILGMEALFDNADQTRESMEVDRQVLAEMKFSGESLSEIAEAQVDEENTPPPRTPPSSPPMKTPPAPPPPPPQVPEPPPPVEPPKPPEPKATEPERPRAEPGDFLPLDDGD
ncbi:MAG: hypothetical protein ABFS86_04925 [Planctomycetota bacterium]